MRKLVMPALGTLVLIGAVIFFLNKGPKGGVGEEGLRASESELEKSLQIANPSEEQLRREIQVLQETARSANEDIAATDQATVQSDGIKLIAPPHPPANPGYDLPALEARFVETLQNTEVDERRRGLHEIASFLAERDVDTASRFMKTILNTRDRLTDMDGNIFATVFVDELSRTDPQGAATWSEILPERLKYPAHQLLAKNWVQQDPQAVDRWAQRLDNDGLRANVFRMMSNSLAVSDPDSFATAWAISLAQRPNDGPRLSEVVARHWGKADFEAASKWTSNLEDLDARESGVLALTRARAEADALAAAAWARDSLKGEMRARAIQETLLVWSGTDPAAAAAWIGRLGEPTIANATFEMIAMAWMRKDPKAAEQWVQEAPVNQQRKDYLRTISRR